MRVPEIANCKLKNEKCKLKSARGDMADPCQLVWQVNQIVGYFGARHELQTPASLPGG